MIKWYWACKRFAVAIAFEKKGEEVGVIIPSRMEKKVLAWTLGCLLAELPVTGLSPRTGMHLCPVPAIGWSSSWKIWDWHRAVVDLECGRQSRILGGVNEKAKPLTSEGLGF